MTALPVALIAFILMAIGALAIIYGMRTYGTETSTTTYEVVAVEDNEFIIAIDDDKTLSVPKK